MSNNELNILRAAFKIPEGVTIVPFAKFEIQKSKVKKPEDSKYQIPQGDGQDVPLETSLLGTPVYSNLVLQGGKYETNVDGVFKEFKSVRIDAVLMTVLQPKIVVKTQIQGRSGTVKEYIGEDDYQITINGIITGSNGRRPVDDIADLKRIVDAPIEIDVVSSYLQSLGIFSIVIEDCTWNQDAGGYFYQAFTMQASSDIPVELRLTNV